METLRSASGVADKLQCLDLEDEGPSATHGMSTSKSRWLIRRPRRRRRVRVQVWPVMELLRSFRQSMARSGSAHDRSPRMDPRLPGSKLGVFLAKLHFLSSQRASRIHHSYQGSHHKLDDPGVRPLLPPGTASFSSSGLVQGV